MPLPKTPTQADFPPPTGGSGALNFEVGAAPATPHDWGLFFYRAISLFICFSMILSPIPVPLAAAEEALAPPAGTFENVENVGGVLRLIYGYTSGAYTSEIISAERIVRWELSWKKEEPSIPGVLVFGVAEEAEVLVDGMERIGTRAAGSPTSLSGIDGNSEIIAGEPVMTAGETEGRTLYLTSESPAEFQEVSVTIEENIQTPVETTELPASEENIAVVEDNLAGETAVVAEENLASTEENTEFLTTGENAAVVEENLPAVEENAIPENPAPGNAGHLLRWQHRIDVAGGAENLVLRVVGQTADGQVTVYIWDGSGWEAAGTLDNVRKAVEKTLERKHLVGGSVYVKYDGEAASLSIDYCAVERAVIRNSSARVQARVSRDGVGWSGWEDADGRRVLVGRFLQYRVVLSSESPALSGATGPKAYDVSLSRVEKVKRVRMGALRAGEKGIAQVNEGAVKAVRIAPKADLNDAEVSVELLEALPAGVPALEGKRVLAYAEISTSLLNEEIQEAEIEFEVPKDWLQGTLWRGSRVEVYHFGGARWESLPVAEAGEDSASLRILASTPGFSIFSIVDNTDIDYSQGTHENTENVDNYVRLIQNYTQGRFTSRVFDAGGVAEWDNLQWSFVEPQQPASDIDYVGAEPDTLKDGSSRVGTQWQGSYENTRQPDDGSVENLSEASTGGGSQQITYSYVSTENVYDGTTIDFENAKAADLNYENISENLVELIYYENVEAEQSITSDVPTPAVTLTFTPSAGEYLIIASVEIGSSSTANKVYATFTIDGTVYGETYIVERATTSRTNIGWVKKIALDATEHTAEITYNSGVATDTAYARHAKIVAFKLPSGTQYSERETAKGLTTSFSEITSLTFTPPQPDNYLILVSSEATHGTANRGVYLNLQIDGGVVENDTFALWTTAANDYRSFAYMVVENLDANQHTIRLGGWTSGGTGTAKRARIVAIPLAGMIYYENENMERGSTASTTPTNAFVYSPTIANTGYHLAMASSLYRSGSATVPAFNGFWIGSENCSEAGDTQRSAAPYISGLFLKRANLTAGTNTFALKHWIGGASTTYTENMNMAIIYPFARYFDVEHTIMAAPSKDNYELQVRYYVTGESGDTEPAYVYLWNFFTGQWDQVGTLSGGTPSSPNTFTYDITGTNYILGTGMVRVRFRQPQSDIKQTSLMLDYVRVREIKLLAPGQSLRWQHTITGVGTGYENYDLKIRGYAYGDPVVEDIYIYVWNVSTNSWEFLNDYIPKNTPSTRTFRLSPISNYLDGDNIHVKFEDSNPSDSTTTYVILDMVRIEEAFWGTSDVKLQLRVSEDNISWTDWMGPSGTSNTYFEAATTSMENIPDNRYIQYRIYFSTNTANLTGASGPKVDWVKINASTLPNLISPANGSTTNNPTPTFYWETVAADNYHIQIATDINFTNPVVDNENIPGSENTWTPTSPLADNPYYWRVQRRYNNKWYAWVAPWSFRVDTLAPSPPDLYSPADGTITNDNTPRLKWTVPDENSYPLTYQLMISRNTSFTDLVPGYNPSPWLSDNFHEVSELSDGTYYWKVKAKDNAGNEGLYTSYYWSFRIDTKPPAVPSPIATPQYVRPQPNLDWPAVTLDNAGNTEMTTPIYYQVYISTDPGFPAAATQTSGWITDDNWIAIPATANNTTYYWKVSARDNIWNISENSAVLSFVVDNRPPTVVSLYKPENNADLETLSVNFQWYWASDGESGIENYWIQIDDEPTFTSPFTENTLRPPSENTYLFNFSSYGTYYWRVKARDFVGNENEWSYVFKVSLRRWILVESWTAAVNAPITGWALREDWTDTITTTAQWQLAEGWTSTIAAPIPAPVLLTPENGKNLNDKAPTLDWDNLQPADSFALWVDDEPTFTPPYIVEKVLSASSYDFDQDFIELSDGVYYWRVRMTRTGSNSDNSETWQFRVDTIPPAVLPLLHPANGENLGNDALGENKNNTPMLDWQTVDENSYPLVYEVQVATDQSF
ncbi:MAG: PGF-pre-PGF domain-containing protein, partial [Candidatus Hadarchaeales archaeon]